VVIIAQDGFGGTGNRIILVHLIPGDNEAVITQEQVSRTGLLLSTRFDSEDKIFIAPITELPTVTALSHGMIPKKASAHYTVDGHTYGGDWFTSRSMQAQLIETIRPSRSRIEVIPGNAGGAPALVSSVENDLQQVFYIDDDGKYWHLAGGIRVGEKKTLEPSTQSDFYAWLGASRRDAGARVNFLLDQSIQRHGYFYAMAEDPKGDAVPTMSSIHWQTAKVIYLGPCAVQKGVANP